jgi:hypothetical protein
MALLDPDTKYRVQQYPGVAWWYTGDETKADEDTYWTGYEQPTGRVTMVMVGDDRKFAIDPDECTPLDDDDYCSGCGQIGCKGDRLVMDV